MVRKVLKYPDPVLEKPCDPIPERELGTPELESLVADMFETMYDHKGVGLAAPQIGVLRRLAVVDLSLGEEESERLVIINPEITFKDGTQREEEGCLCFPGIREKVTRAKTVTVKARNEAGEQFEITREDLMARALQHEIDHLDGILFIRHVSVLKRDLIRRKIRKLIKAGEWD